MNEKLGGNSLGTRNNIEDVYMTQFLFYKGKKNMTLSIASVCMTYNNANVSSYHCWICPPIIFILYST